MYLPTKERLFKQVKQIVNNGKFIMVFNFKIIRFDFV